ncbi:hypothetical protein ACWCQW_54590 [Streptomyces mirabilis]
MVAVIAATGATWVFDRTSGVGEDAVTASCSIPGVWPAATLGGDIRFFTNLDLAAGHARTLVIAPMPDPVLDATPSSALLSCAGGTLVWMTLCRCPRSMIAVAMSLVGAGISFTRSAPRPRGAIAVADGPQGQHEACHGGDGVRIRDRHVRQRASQRLRGTAGTGWPA